MASEFEEAWLRLRPLAEFDGYLFGSDGSVWSCWKHKRRGPRHGSYSFKSDEYRQLKPMPNQDGYLFVNLRKTGGGVKRNCLVHQLILLAFGFARPSPCHEVCHEHGVKTDNRVGKLRWGTRKENTADAIRHGTMWRGGRRGRKQRAYDRT